MNKTIRVLVACVVIFIGFFVLIMGNDIDYTTINPFERTIWVFKEVSKIGYDVKEAGLDFVRSLNAYVEPTNVWGEIGSRLITGIGGKVLTSIVYSFEVIGDFIVIIFKVIRLIALALIKG